MFDPTVGRWFQEDPKGFAAGDENLYRYVRNSPTNATDPSGMVKVGRIIGRAQSDQYLKETPILLRDGAMVRIIFGQAEERLDRRLAPYAIQLAAEKALTSLGVKNVVVTPGDDLKAPITAAGFEAIKRHVGNKLEDKTTVSADKAWRVLLEGDWELAIYLKGQQYSLAVGYRTGSSKHDSDALLYKRKINNVPVGGADSLTGATIVDRVWAYPNGDNAEQYLGKHVYDIEALEELNWHKNQGFIRKEEYEAIIRDGIFVGNAAFNPGNPSAELPRELWFPGGKLAVTPEMRNLLIRQYKEDCERLGVPQAEYLRYVK